MIAGNRHQEGGQDDEHVRVTCQAGQERAGMGGRASAPGLERVNRKTRRASSPVVAPPPDPGDRGRADLDTNRR